MLNINTIIIIVASVLFGLLIGINQYRNHRKDKFDRRDALAFALLYGGFGVLMAVFVFANGMRWLSK